LIVGLKKSLGIGGLIGSLNPVRRVERMIEAGQHLAKGEIQGAAREAYGNDVALQSAITGHKTTAASEKAIMSNQYTAAAATAVATYYGGPIAGAAVQARATQVQGKKAEKDAKKAAAQAQDDFNQAFDDLGATITEGLGEPEPEDPIERRYLHNRRRTQTLFSPGLGGGGASLGRPTLYGGG
jgi:hypothetical protein